MAACQWAPAMLIGAILISYFCYVHNFGVNVPFWDDWTLGAYVLRLSAGDLRLTDLLIAKNNEHLVGVPFTLMSLFYLATGYNTKLTPYLSAVLQCASFTVLLGIVWRSLQLLQTNKWHGLVLALLFFSLAPTQNILWSFQLPWNLITLFFFGSLWFLSRALERQRGNGFRPVVAAAAFATLASFSSAQGLVVWLAGTIFLLVSMSDCPKQALCDRRLLLWLSCALSCAALYAWIFFLTPTPHLASPETFRSVIGSPVAISRFTLGILSTAWGGHLGAKAPVAGAIIAIGLLVALVLARGSLRGERLALPLSLVTYGAACTLLVAGARLPFGDAAAVESRYATNVLITVAGSYLFVIQVAEKTRHVKTAVAGECFMVILIAATFITSALRAIEVGRNWRLERGLGAMILLNFENEPRFKIERTLCWTADIVLKQVPVLKAHALSTFREGKSAIPQESAVYAEPPSILQELIESRPEDVQALHRLWDVYVVAWDLRGLFPIESPTLAHDLIRWAAASAQGGHFLATHLAEYADNYGRISADLDAGAKRKLGR